MTVTISSTTDSEAVVTEVAEQANKPVEIPAAPEEVVAVAQRYSQPDVHSEEAPTAETMDAAGLGEESSPEVIASEPEVVESDDGEEPETVDTKDETEDADVEKPKRRRRRGRSYKDRASQLAREKAVEKSRADALAVELQAIKTAAARVVPPPPTPTPPAPAKTGSDEDVVDVAPRYRQPVPETDAAPVAAAGRPAQDDFETYEQFQEALVDWKVNLRLTEHDVEARERIERASAQRAQEAIVAAHTSRIDAFRSEHDDFDAVIEQGRDLPMTRPMQDSVLNSDMGPAVMYHLCRFPEECDRISAMAPMAAIREMGKLEARIEAAQTGPASPAASLTQAPRPIKPVGGGVTASTVPLDQMDYQSYRRARMQGRDR